MKFNFVCSLLVLSTSAYAFASTPIKQVIICEGTAEIQGALFVNRSKLRLELNSVKDSYGRLGHVAKIDGKSFFHSPDLAFCKSAKDDFIVCKGSGVGNGPELLVEIDKKSMEASGTYFNPGAKRMYVPNNANTYVFERLTCKKIK